MSEKYMFTKKMSLCGLFVSEDRRLHVNRHISGLIALCLNIDFYVKSNSSFAWRFIGVFCVTEKATNRRKNVTFFFLQKSRNSLPLVLKFQIPLSEPSLMPLTWEALMFFFLVKFAFQNTQEIRTLKAVFN